MWQAGWHFTQWQNIARSPLMPFLLPPVFHPLSRAFFSFSFSWDFHLILFLCYSLNVFPLSDSFLDFVFFRSPHFALSICFFFSGTLSQSLLPPPLLQSSNGWVKKLVVRLKQHLGILSTCFSAHCVCACMRAHYKVSCLFIVTEIFQLFLQWPILWFNC